jgi:hypothetical protein
VSAGNIRLHRPVCQLDHEDSMEAGLHHSRTMPLLASQLLVVEQAQEVLEEQLQVWNQ